MRNEKATGGVFLFNETKPTDIFTPEDFTEEHFAIARETSRFVEKEILPLEPEFEAKNYEVIRGLIRAFAELGFLGADIPEEWGGSELDKMGSALIIEKLGLASYFMVAQTAHIGIGTLPLLFYGNQEQKERYLRKMTAGEIIGAYALTEPEAGSDAASMRMKAVLSEDGSHYILNGDKIWISNAGFADLFTVFAKVDGDPRKITAFLVTRDTPGLTIGNEEHKLGLEGSSTCSLAFSDARVPKENVLGEIGEGFKIALNILNLGRFKLAMNCIGCGKVILSFIAEHAKNRIAFKRPISEFGLIKEKFAGMITRLWLAESMGYRTAGLLEASLSDLEDGDNRGIMTAIGNHAVECSINKVFGSEVLASLIDESLQIHGGMGFEWSQPTARAYRDNRVNRIFEGTNEINRLLIIDKIVRGALKGHLPLFAKSREYRTECLKQKERPRTEDGVLKEEILILNNLKKLIVILFGASVMKFQKGFAQEQEIMGRLSDGIITIFVLESGIARTLKLLDSQSSRVGQEVDMVRIAAREACYDLGSAASEIAYKLNGGTEEYKYLIHELTSHDLLDMISIRRSVADRYLDLSWRFK